MASSNPQIVGAGIGAGAPFNAGFVAYVTQASPPIISTFVAKVTADGAVTGILSIPSSLGVYNAIAGATEMLRIQGGMIVSGTGTDSVQIGRGAIASNTNSTALGTLATASGLDSAALGPSCTASNTNAVAVGINVTADAANVIVIGIGSASAGHSGILIGSASSFFQAGGILIGGASTISGHAGGAQAIVIGSNASIMLPGTGGGDGVVIGDSALGSNSDTIIGFSAQANQSATAGNPGTVLIGSAATSPTLNAGCVIIGAGATSSGVAGIAIGQGAKIGTGANNTIVGAASQVIGAIAGGVIVGQGSELNTGSSGIIIGSGLTTTLNGGGWFGAPNTNVVTMVIGQGDTVAAPSGRTIRFTNGLGTDNAAGSVTFQAPLSTGAGLPATFIFAIGIAGVTGTTLQTPATAMTLDGSVAATTTRMLLYTQDTATVQRVQTITNAAILTLLGLGAGRLLYVPA